VERREWWAALLGLGLGVAIGVAIGLLLRSPGRGRSSSYEFRLPVVTG